MEYLLRIPQEILSKIIGYMNPRDYLNLHLTIVKLLSADIGINFKRRIFNHHINKNNISNKELECCNYNCYMNLNYDMKYGGGDILIINTNIRHFPSENDEEDNNCGEEEDNNCGEEEEDNNCGEEEDNNCGEEEEDNNCGEEEEEEESLNIEHYFSNWTENSNNECVNDNFYLHNCTLYKNNNGEMKGIHHHNIKYCNNNEYWFISNIEPFNRASFNLKLNMRNKALNKFDIVMYDNYNIINDIIHTFLTHIHSEFSFKFQKVIRYKFGSMMSELLDSTGGYISGSYILQLLYGEEYKSSDIDIFVRLEPYAKYLEELDKYDAYMKYNKKYNKKYNEYHNHLLDEYIENIDRIMKKYYYTRIKDTSQRFYRNGQGIVIHKIVNYINRDNKSKPHIQFIFNSKSHDKKRTQNKSIYDLQDINLESTNRSTYDIVTYSYFINDDLKDTFDFDVLENSFDYKRGLVIHNIPNVINKAIGSKDKIYRTQLGRLKKYMERGFKLTNYDSYKCFDILIKKNIKSETKIKDMYVKLSKLKERNKQLNEEVKKTKIQLKKEIKEEIKDDLVKRVAKLCR